MDKPLRTAKGNKILTIDESSDAGCGSKRRGDGSSRRQELQEFRSSGVRSQEHPTGRAREDLRRNSRSWASHDKSELYGGASEAKAEITVARGVRAL